MGTWQAKFGSVAEITASPGGWCVLTIAGSVYSDYNGQAALVAASKFSSATKQCVVTEEFPPNPAHTSVGGSAQLLFNIDKTAILVDGVPTDFFSLPSGFRILTANFRIHTNAQGGTTKIQQNGQNLTTISPDNGTDTTIAVSGNIGPIDVFNNTYGVQFTTAAGWTPPVTASIGGTNTDGIVIEGTYDIVTYDFTGAVDGVHIEPSTAIEPLSKTLPGSSGIVPLASDGLLAPGEITPGYTFPPVTVDGMTYVSDLTSGAIQVGDLIRIQTPTPSLDLTTVTDIYLTYTPAVGSPIQVNIINIYIFLITVDLIIFMLPPYIELTFDASPPSTAPDVTVIPKIYVDGTTFHGTINLPPIKILMENASGIYFIDKSARHDTVYDNTNPPATIDVAILNPFAKTGFIGG